MFREKKLADNMFDRDFILSRMCSLSRVLLKNPVGKYATNFSTVVKGLSGPKNINRLLGISFNLQENSVQFFHTDSHTNITLRGMTDIMGLSTQQYKKVCGRAWNLLPMDELPTAVSDIMQHLEINPNLEENVGRVFKYLQSVKNVYVLDIQEVNGCFVMLIPISRDRGSFFEGLGGSCPEANDQEEFDDKYVEDIALERIQNMDSEAVIAHEDMKRAVEQGYLFETPSLWKRIKEMFSRIFKSL